MAADLTDEQWEGKFCAGRNLQPYPDVNSIAPAPVSGAIVSPIHLMMLPVVVPHPVVVRPVVVMVVVVVVVVTIVVPMMVVALTEAQ